MRVRPADPSDRERIEELARTTFESSYSLSPEGIETILEEEFAADPLSERIESEDHALFVVEADEGVLGSVEVELGEGPVLRWLHVDPEQRGRGIGTMLFEHVTSEVATEREPLSARILTEADEGAGFCEQFGFARSGREECEFGSESLWEFVYVPDHGGAEPTTEPSVSVPETVTIDGRQLFLDREDDVPGTQGPFFHIYETEECEERYGFFCSNCGSTDTGSDSLGRLECQNCGNKHLADEWDGAYF